MDMDTDIAEGQSQESAEPRVIAPQVTNRFLYVDIAALRAKQLRRGALPRVDGMSDPAGYRDPPHKPERIAMEEVRRGLVQYDLPPLKAAAGEQGS
jgi:DNA-directed RNA polymerase subunit K/omega